MRALFSAFLLCITISAVSQVTISAQAGWNSNSLHNTNSYKYYGGNSGWQAGLQATYALKHWFVYSGLQLDKNVFYVNYYTLNGSVKNIYHPLYISVPLGLGYQFSLGKTVSLQLYGGVYGSAGIGGKIKTTSYFCGDFVACPEPGPGVTTAGNIKYGNNNDDNLAKNNAGLQFGAGLGAFKKYELRFTYNAGLNNIFPNNDNSSRFTLNTIAVNARINLFTLGHR